MSDSTGTDDETYDDYSTVVTSDESLRRYDGQSAEETEKTFLAMVRMCDVSSVKSLLEGNSDLDLNCKNYQGMTGLNLAIEANCEQMVDLLLSRAGLEIGDSLMHAIRENCYSIVIKLLDIIESENPDGVHLGYEHSTEFPSYLTPLMLAAQCGHFKLISLLLKRGHTIQIPHKPRCLCKEVCKSLAQLNNGLGASELKLSVFRALSNPAYISLTSEDPIHTAFQLSKVLRQHGDVNRIFKSDYESLDMQTRMFPVHLVGLCRSSVEMEQLLVRREGCSFFGTFPYHRLVMAMDLKQKEFVAHAYVQQTLETAWTGDWHEWRRYGSVRKSSLVFPRIAMLPGIVLLYLFLPYSKVGQRYALPVNRMLNYLASYVVFLAVLTYRNNTHKAGGPAQSSWISESVLVLYVTAYATRAVKLSLVQGPGRYFTMLWNVYDCVNLAVLSATFVCWWLSYTNAQTDDDGGGRPTERKYWRSSDPALVAEGLLAVATVMSYLRLLFLCQLSYALGPMQVSLGKMTTDFARFAILFGIIIVAFTAGLCTLYQCYDGMTSTDPATGYEVTQDDSFVNVYSTLKTLFWGVFCMTSSTAGTVIVETPPADDADDPAEAAAVAVNSHYFTQAVGTALYSAFETLSVVVMLNMLIAAMTNTFQRVTGNSYIEWVFGRTQVFLSFSMHTELPPPLNVLPSAYCFVDACGCMGSCCRAGAIGVANMMSFKRFNKGTDGDFKTLMAKLVRRYFRDKLSTGVVRQCNPICG